MTPNQAGGTGTSSGSTQTFDRILGRVRRRWWLSRLLEAFVIAVALAVVVTVVAITYMAWMLFDAVAVEQARTLVYWSVPALALLVLLPRLLRFMSRASAARYVESRNRELDALVISATEISERTRSDGWAAPKGSLTAVLLERAAAVCAGPEIRTLEIGRLRRSATLLAIVLILAGAVAILGSPPIRHGMALLLAPVSEPGAVNPYRLGVEPGDLTLIEGEDLAVSAIPEGFRPDSIELLTRVPGDENWTHAPMTASGDTARHDALLLNMKAPLEYYVRSGPVESSLHLIDVTPRPRISRIDLRYEYPPHTGRAPELVRDGTAIRGVRGTRIEIRVVPDRPLAVGELVLDGRKRIPLNPVGDELRAGIELDQDGLYRIELSTGKAEMTRASGEHPIRVFEDGRPSIALTWPGRDARVTSIEEISISVQAEDDVALHNPELVLNINGAEERIVQFNPDPAAPGKLTGTHLLSLEALSLQPGDLISYYARVSDAVDDSRRIAATDLYFMDIRPYEQHFRRARAGGGGGGSGGQGDAELTAQQRSLVVALFKLQRDRALIENSLFEQRIVTLRQAQGRIRERLDAIVRRLGSRGMMSELQAYGTLAEELPQASKAMIEVESRLDIEDLDNALPGARRALLHLQRADAAFRDVQIAQSRSGGGGNSGSQAELANLFRLEMDKFRNQYEEMQRGRWNTQDRNLDQALNKLQELARRQQREIERTRLRGQRNRGNPAGPNSQQALAEEVEELMRELERLTRQRDDAASEQARRSLEQLRTARNAMKQAGQTGDAEAGRKALERLRTARRELKHARPDSLASGIDKAVRRSRSAATEQRAIMDQLDSDLEAGESDRQRIGELVRRKRLLARELRDLTSDVENLRRQALNEQSRATGDLEATGRTLSERMLEERILDSARALREDPRGHAESGEIDLEADLESVQKKLAQAGRSQSQDKGPDRQAALERLRALVRNLKADQQRLAEAANRGSRQAGTAGNKGDQASQNPAVGSAQGQAGTGGGVGSYGGYDRGYSIDPSTIRRQMTERMGEISALRDQFAGIGDLANDVEAILATLNETRRDGIDGTELETLRMRQARLLAHLQNLEFALRESAQKEPERFIARQSVVLTPHYEALVDDYYRKLSEKAVLQ